MENGQYDQDWKYIHMMPEEAAQAADDLRARSVLPGHAGPLCWRNTAGTIRTSGGGNGEGREWRLVAPMLGEPVWVADKTQSFNAWWR